MGASIIIMVVDSTEFYWSLSYISWGAEKTSQHDVGWFTKSPNTSSKYVMMSPFCMRKITKSKLQENTIQRRNWILNLVVSLNLFRPLCWKSYNPPACITNTLPDVWLFTICLIKSLKFMVSSLVSIWKLSFLSWKLVYKYLCQLVSFSCLQVWKADEST